MAWFRRKRSIEDAAPEQRDSYAVYAPLSGLPNSSAGIAVTSETALRSAAVSACVRVLKTTIANLPVDEVLMQGEIRTPVSASSIVKRPSSGTRRQFVAQVADSLITAGNAYGMVVRHDANGRPLQIETICPDDVRWWKVDGVPTAHIESQPQALYPDGPLIHIPATAFLRAGWPVAEAPIDLARESIGTALAAERFGGQFFGEGIHPTTLFKSDQELDRPAAMNAKNQFITTMRNREPLVIGSGWDMEQIPVDPNDSQFIDLMRFEVEQACRFFGVPPSMVFAAISGQNITYANVSESDLTFLKYAVQSWLLDIEDAWSSWLTQPRVVKFNVSSLLRMDDLKRHELYERRLNSKTITINEIRTKEDEPAFEGAEYDEPGIPGGGAPTPEPPTEEPPSE